MTRFEPNKRSAGLARLSSVVAAVAVLLVPAAARAAIDGVDRHHVHPHGRARAISPSPTGGPSTRGATASTGATMQLPGPTLIVTAGDTVTVTLNNALPAAAGNVSIVFPGHAGHDDPGGVPGLLTQEAPPGGSVTYTFTASQPGTYQYHSGTRPDLQVEMGLYGALIVRPTAPAAGCATSAYDHAATCFDREYLFLLSEMDIDIHRAAELQAAGPGPIELAAEPYHSEYWLINGRAAPDTMAAAGTALLPTQPYNCHAAHAPRRAAAAPGGGRGPRDASLPPPRQPRARPRPRRPPAPERHRREPSSPGRCLFTIPSVPGGTVDAIFEWTGKDLGWDMYGHGRATAHLHGYPDNETGCGP